MHLQNLERVNPDLKWRIQLLNISLPPLQQPDHGIGKENITQKLNCNVKHSKKDIITDEGSIAPYTV